MNDTANSIGMAGLGALIATTIFLLVLVVICSRFFRWLKSAGFRFQDFEAHQDRNGVRLNSAFKRDGFEQRGPFTRPTAPADPGPALFMKPEDVLTGYTIMVGLAAEKLRKGDRVAVTDKAGYVRLATAAETELGTIDNDALPEQQVRIRIPKGSSIPGEAAAN